MHSKTRQFLDRMGRQKGKSFQFIDRVGLLRVVLVEEKDTATGKVIYRRTAHDDAGRVTFESYPAATSAATAGINTAFDAIGRLQARQTTDGITLETVVHLSDNRRQVTDADNRTTTTSVPIRRASRNRPTRLQARSQSTRSD